MAQSGVVRQNHALITGAASGLGRALALCLAADGWAIALADVEDADSSETLRLVTEAGGSGWIEHLDVRRIEEWGELRERLQNRWDHLDLLVNNAGVFGAGPVGEFSIEDWQWIVDVNIWNAINGCHTFVEWLKVNPHGAHIINTCSSAALIPFPRLAAYGLTKAAVLALSESLYGELLPFNVGVTALCPDSFHTHILEGARFSDDEIREEAKQEFARATLAPGAVAEAAIRAMKRKQLYVVMPFKARFYWRLKRLAPVRLLERIAREAEAERKAFVQKSVGGPSAEHGTN
jgi:short-subunit dehydrogenase